MQAITILLGIVVLLAGRRLFWLTVAIVGFVTGLALALSLFDIQPMWLVWLVALIAGVLGALLAIFLQKVAVSIAGFLMGGYLLVWLAQNLVNLNQLDWLVYIIGGVIGAILAVAVFELALIGLTSLFGAAIITQVINLEPAANIILFVVLLIIGIAAQSRYLSRSPTSG